jgi:cold shock CspA family protein
MASARSAQLAAQVAAQDSRRQEQAQCLAVARSLESSLKKGADPRPGKVVKSEVLGQLDTWNEERAFGFIRSPDGERFFCHNSGFSAPCEKYDLVKFNVFETTGTGEQKAVNVTQHQHDCVELAKGQVGRMEQRHLIRGADGKTFQCSEFKEDPESFRLRDKVQFDSVWDGRFKAVNIRHIKTEWSQEEWDQWRSLWSNQETQKEQKPRKAWQRRADPEQADDASTVASLSLDTVTAPLQVTAPKQVPTVLPKEDEGSPKSGTSGEWDAPKCGEWAPTQKSTPAEASLESADQVPPPPLAPPPMPPCAIGVADEIRKLAELMREGILTDEEFQVQKKRLLNC